MSSVRKHTVADRLAGILDEDIVYALLHLVPVRFKESHVLEILDQAARKYGGMFLMFEKQRNGNNKPLWDIMRSFASFGTIFRQGMTDWFVASPHTRGPHGLSKLHKFTPAQQDLLRQLALQLGALAQARAA